MPHRTTGNSPRKHNVLKLQEAEGVIYWWVKWFYAKGDQVVGPVDRAELESLFSSGTITTGTMIVQEGMYDWVPYRDLKKTTQFLFAAAERPPKSGTD